MRTILTFILFSFLLASCQQKQSAEASYSVADIAEEIQIAPITRQQAVEPASPPLPPVNTPSVVKKKIIKDARIGMQVDKLEKAKLRIDSLVKNQAAYYEKESLNNSDWEATYNLKIRIPHTNFEKFIQELETGTGEIKYKEIDARDVTDDFIDLETRLQNKKNYLVRYNELLAKAQTVKDILEIEGKIREIEEEIESTTGRLNYLSDLVGYSTLELTVSETKNFKYNPVSRSNFIEKLKEALSRGWFGLVDFTLFFINLWPLWIFVAAILYLWKKYKRGKRKKV
ncbi:MAG: DUF4349 domain-containing protein [Mangrovibacterium sp.]